jgi:hypothetical protein
MTMTCAVSWARLGAEDVANQGVASRWPKIGARYRIIAQRPVRRMARVAGGEPIQQKLIVFGTVDWLPGVQAKQCVLAKGTIKARL